MSKKPNGEELFPGFLKNAKAAAKAALPKGQPGQFCRNCEHFLKHQFTDRLNYCTQKIGHRSGSFGKTKRTAWCTLWKAISGS